MKIGISFCRNQWIRLKHATKNVRRTVQLTDTHVCLVATKMWRQHWLARLSSYLDGIYGQTEIDEKLFTFTQRKIPIGIANSVGPYLKYTKWYTHLRKYTFSDIYWKWADVAYVFCGRLLIKLFSRIYIEQTILLRYFGEVHFKYSSCYLIVV